MKRFIQYISEIILITFILIIITFFSIVYYQKDVFYPSYQSMIQDKYRILKETNEPKIIVVSGSSSAFGLDQEMLENATGYKVANLGLHAGFGPWFYSELSKANINEGDIVLLAYEYGWANEEDFENIGADLVMSGIDDNIEMYKYIFPEKVDSILGYLSFDLNSGQMVTIPDGPYNVVTNEDFENILSSNISKKSEEYLRTYKKYAESLGASVFFVAPPLCIEGLQNDPEVLLELKKQEELCIGIPYISDPLQYLFSSDLMSNARYHCNRKGMKLRTQMLIEDLKNAKIID